MSDIADIDKNAIIRPGKAPVWRVLGRPPHRETLKAHARTPGTFGADIEFREDCGSDECCGVLFVATPDGGLYGSDLARIQFYFDRDKAEALVFEFDRWQKKFFARGLEELLNRRLY